MLKIFTLEKINELSVLNKKMQVEEVPMQIVLFQVPLIIFECKCHRKYQCTHFQWHLVILRFPL